MSVHIVVGTLWNTREQANRIDQGSLSAVVVEVFMEKREMD